MDSLLSLSDVNVSLTVSFPLSNERGRLAPAVGVPQPDAFGMCAFGPHVSL